MRSDLEKLLDMLEAIERIERYAVQGRSAYEQNELIQTWFIQNLQIIGEAARALTS
ncbi:nucleotidyltransferase [Limnospira fusiformis KN01]|nr:MULTISPECIES: HepT-like ribonuclease domain-containing protein [Limnospira]EKD07313.1 nucleotidyltransferase [Arthrospira platensis C1]MDC0839974.1 nucleotidyltransferase [Limnoraphis robusta]MDY7052785.1 nucleotidyltransferase [Limnospira fusiformis LS22]EDZ93365.1 nucleotidyltransferase [Limnospira maxima CS-328]MDT9188551.1 nucleotidyltransferase [Limnospira sp. PMC 894.15]